MIPAGVSLLQQIRRLPAVVVFADAMPDEIHRALDAGFDDYWTKPLDLARIQPALRLLLNARGRSGGTMSV